MVKWWKRWRSAREIPFSGAVTKWLVGGEGGSHCTAIERQLSSTCDGESASVWYFDCRNWYRCGGVEPAEGDLEDDLWKSQLIECNKQLLQLGFFSSH